MNRHVILRSADGCLIHGDCLTEVPAQFSRPTCQLVYVDPPYNAGVKRSARRGVGHRHLGNPAYEDVWGGLSGFLSMLEPRLETWRDVLLPEGSLWLHLDYRTVHDVKVLADRVFGHGAFWGEIVWVPGNGARRRRGPSVTHQTLLLYARGKDPIYNHDDPALREPYAATSRSMHFRSTDADGRNYRERTIADRTYRYYEDVGRRLGSVWSDCPAMRANTPLDREATGYPTQKPEKLLERIVRAASLAGGTILDPMCGSGTTLVAARRCKRRWLGVDKSSVAVEIAHQRLLGTDTPP